MTNYQQTGTVAVGAGAVGIENVAGFGARRFMQEMYQQMPSSQSNNDYYSDQPSSHNGYRQDYTTHDHYGNGQSGSRGNGSRYHQSPAATVSALPSTSLSYDQKPATESTYRSHRQNDRQVYERQQKSFHTQAPSLAARATTRPGADARTVRRSNTVESSVTDSTAGLAYARSGDSQYSRNEQSRHTSTRLSTRRTPALQNTMADRATIYDDDYEESADDTTLDAAPQPPSPASATLGDVSTDASFTIVRATVLEPELPKAKCADCGEKLDFEELASHTCQPSSASRPPLLTIQISPSASSSTLSSSATSPALTTPRSPFFDRYNTMINDSGPLSPAVFGTVRQVVQGRVDEGDDETPKAHAVRIVGTHAAIKVSHVKATGSGDAAKMQAHLASSPSPPLEPPPVMQRSASDTQADAAARRKMIEQQRAAKKKDMMASPMPRAATTTSLSSRSIAKDDLSRSASARDAPKQPASTQRVHALAVSESQHTKKDSSSSLSSTNTDSSERMGVSRHQQFARRAPTTTITPSTSYEQMEDRVEKPSAKASTGSVSSKQARERGRVDLSGIEEMMKGLTSSPEPLQRALTDVPRKSGHERETAASVSASSTNKTERERALELELERLRDKERSRQLQAMRLKERKRKERAAKRCCICDCSLSSSRTPFVERDGKLLCARDWKELYLPKCRKCNLIVEKGAVKSSDGALRGVFHRSCFSCAACEAPFTDGSFYVFNNQPYCSRHYHRLNGSLCRECESGIEGDCRQTDTGDRFHPQCFSCQYSSKSGTCHEVLADYYIVDGQRLCERHADKVARRLAKAGQKQLDLRAQKRMTMLRSLR